VNAVEIDNAVSKRTPGGPGGPSEVLKSAHKSEGAPQRIDGTAGRCINHTMSVRRSIDGSQSATLASFASVVARLRACLP
jgi:hypothetical protein